MRSLARSNVVLNLRLRPPAGQLATEAVGDWLRERAVILVPHYRGEVLHRNGVVTASFGSVSQIRARRAVRAGWAIRFAAYASQATFAIAIALDEYQNSVPVPENSFVVSSLIVDRLRGAVQLRPFIDMRPRDDVDFMMVERFSNRVEQQLAELRGLYDIKVDARLQPLLRRSSQWHDVLVETHKALRREFGWKVRLIIESESDYQRARSSLVLRIVARGDPKDWASRFESFARSWWLDVPRTIRERLQLDLRLVQT